MPHVFFNLNSRLDIRDSRFFFIEDARKGMKAPETRAMPCKYYDSYTNGSNARWSTQWGWQPWL